MEADFKIGDPVEVIDEGLAMLRQFAPPNAKPNHHGIVSEILEDGTIVVEFPLEGKNHSQAAPYPANKVKHLTSGPQGGGNEGKITETKT